jgi:hypothetical protein
VKNHPPLHQFFLFFLLICDIKNLSNSFQKTGKLVKLTQGKKNTFPNFWSKKIQNLLLENLCSIPVRTSFHCSHAKKPLKNHTKKNNKKHMFVESNILG